MSPLVGYLGPAGTFTEEALLAQPDLAEAELQPYSSIPAVLEATAKGDVGVGFTAVENSIEGAVNVALDTLVFNLKLLIQREVVMDIALHLLGLSGTQLNEIQRVVSFPVATAQCRRWLQKELPHVEEVASNSTAAAAAALAEGTDRATAVIGTRLAKELYGLEVLVPDIQDHSENQTRFVVVARSGIPAPTGNDKTSIVVFQHAERPGSLMGMLAEFAARSINLTKLESRPTKKALGDYCFLIDLEGHIADDLVADCLKSIRAKHGDVKFLGSYPSAAPHQNGSSNSLRSNGFSDAENWVNDLRHGLNRE